jgi:hypothetical protein
MKSGIKMNRKETHVLTLANLNKISPKSKRSQVTIFIILALIIVGAIITYFIFRGSADKEEFAETEPLNVGSVHSIIQDCIRIRFLDGVRLVGYYGGYITEPEDVPLEYPPVHYGYNQGRKTLASKEEIARQIATYIEISLPVCFNIDNFPDFNLSMRRPNAEVEIEDEFVSASVVFPIAVEKGDQSFTISRKYDAMLPIRLGKIHDTASRIIDMEIDDPDNINMGYLLDSEFYTRIIPYSDEFIIYSITDSEVTVEGVPYTFRFSNKFKEEQ